MLQKVQHRQLQDTCNLLRGGREGKHFKERKKLKHRRCCLTLRSRLWGNGLFKFMLQQHISPILSLSDQNSPMCKCAVRKEQGQSLVTRLQSMRKEDRRGKHKEARVLGTRRTVSWTRAELCPPDHCLQSPSFSPRDIWLWVFPWYVSHAPHPTVHLPGYFSSSSVKGR